VSRFPKRAVFEIDIYVQKEWVKNACACNSPYLGHNTQFWSRDSTCYKAGGLSPITLNQKWEHSSPQRNSDAGMGGMRKVSCPLRRPNFRNRLQRALSLSSLESEDTGSVSSSATGNTTGEESPSQEENDSGDQEDSDAADESEQEAARQKRTVFGHETDSEIRGQTQLSGNSNTVALECLTELIQFHADII
jgi:hypothetical protein